MINRRSSATAIASPPRARFPLHWLRASLSSSLQAWHRGVVHQLVWLPKIRGRAQRSLCLLNRGAPAHAHLCQLPPPHRVRQGRRHRASRPFDHPLRRSSRSWTKPSREPRARARPRLRPQRMASFSMRSRSALLESTNDMLKDVVSSRCNKRVSQLNPPRDLRFATQPRVACEYARKHLGLRYIGR